MSLSTKPIRRWCTVSSTATEVIWLHYVSAHGETKAAYLRRICGYYGARQSVEQLLLGAKAGPDSRCDEAARKIGFSHGQLEVCPPRPLATKTTTNHEETRGYRLDDSESGWYSDGRAHPRFPMPANRIPQHRREPSLQSRPDDLLAARQGRMGGPGGHKLRGNAEGLRSGLAAPSRRGGALFLLGRHARGVRPISPDLNCDSEIGALLPPRAGGATQGGAGTIRGRSSAAEQPACIRQAEGSSPSDSTISGRRGDRSDGFESPCGAGEGAASAISLNQGRVDAAPGHGVAAPTASERDASPVSASAGSTAVAAAAAKRPTGRSVTAGRDPRLLSGLGAADLSKALRGNLQGSGAAVGSLFVGRVADARHRSSTNSIGDGYPHTSATARRKARLARLSFFPFSRSHRLAHCAGLSRLFPFGVIHAVAAVAA